MLAAAAVLPRLAGFAPSSLWLDDAWMALVHKAGSVTDSVGLGPSAPGFAVLLYAWLKVAGFSNAHAQLLALAFGIAAVAAVYLVGVALGLRRLPAAAAAVLLAVSPVHARYSVAVKQYTLDSLLAAVVLLLGVRAAAAAEPANHRRWAALCGMGAAAVVMSGSTLPVAAAAVAVPALAALWRTRRPSLELAWPAAWLAAMAVWALAVVRPRVPDAIHDFWRGSYVDGPRSLVDAAWRVARGFTALPPALTVVLVALALATAWRRQPALTAMVGLSLLGAVALAVMEAAPLGTGRTDIYLFPGLALLLAAAANPLPARVLAAAVTAAAVVLYPSHDLPYPQEDARPLVRLVEDRYRPGDEVVVYPLTSYAFALYTRWPVTLTRDDHDPDATGFSRSVDHPGVVLLASPRTSPPLAEQLDGRLDGPRVWVLTVTGHSDFADIGPALRSRGYQTAEVHRRPGAVLVLWTRLGPGAGAPPA